ncbi:DUF6366 family protein [Lentibacillus sp. N15]|uniref:DUF6366 family protein n=1 Tax=Lentibacillus songyuanensis TaxID=3136161 RepID=UPI0031BAA2FD
MDRDNEIPEEKRERMRQDELKNPSSSIHGSGLPDLVGGLGWKSFGIVILILIMCFIVYTVFFR